MPNTYIEFFKVETILRNIYLITIVWGTLTYYIGNVPRIHVGGGVKGKVMRPCQTTLVSQTHKSP